MSDGFYDAKVGLRVEFYRTPGGGNKGDCATEVHGLGGGDVAGGRSMSLTDLPDDVCLLIANII